MSAPVIPHCSLSTGPAGDILLHKLRVFLTEETRILVPVYQCQKRFNGLHFRFWIVPMPFQVLPLPVYLPDALGSYLGTFCDSYFEGVLRISPFRADLEYLYALPVNSTARIELLANMRRGPPILHKSCDRLLTRL
jgi:hypothetical protein